LLQRYDQVVPGAAERIIKKFESQSEHRQRLESIVVKTDSWKSILGVVFGFILAIGAIAGGIYTALQDHPFLGGSLSFAGLAMIVGAFLTTRYSSGKSPKEDS
jgi:uncharacterized membrane protein